MAMPRASAARLSARADGTQGTRPCSSLAAGSPGAGIVAGASHRDRLPHEHKARRLEMGDEPLRDHLGCDLGCLTSRSGAPACKAKREAGFDVVARGRSELFIVGHCRTIAES